MNRELPHHQWSHRHHAAARAGTAVIHDAPSEKQLLAIARLCDEAADHAWQCGEQLDRTAAASIAHAARACTDAADVLRALGSMCRRPFECDRAPVLRRMVESGLMAASECSAACATLGDDTSACGQVETMCSRCSYELRHLLTALVDDDVDERSSAT